MIADISKDLKYYLSLPDTDVLFALGSSKEGLTSAEAKYRLNLLGPNKILSSSKISVFWKAILHSINSFTLILLIAALISLFTLNAANSGIIVVIILISVVFDFHQSHRSLVTMNSLLAKVVTTTSVLRDGQVVEEPHCNIVPGDIIFLHAGDIIPVDAMLLDAKDLHVQQAALTGESFPIEKDTKKQNAEINPVTECKFAVLSGTSVVSGNAVAVVIKTGTHTVFGKVAQSISKTAQTTAFDKGLAQFGYFITQVVFVLVLFILTIGILFKHDPINILLFAIALAVGLTPEFLPMITTVTLAKSAMRMARNQVVIKHLTAIQNLGSMDILCCDKTGTLTKGEMVLQHYISAFGPTSLNTLLLGYLSSIFSTGVENPLDTAVLQKSHHLNPIDSAILKHEPPDIKDYSKADEIPFSSERRYSSIVVTKKGKNFLITKGAPEFVLRKSSYIDDENQLLPLNKDNLEIISKLFNSYFEQGYRVLAVAYREITAKKNYSTDDEMNLVLAGFLIFSDPPHPDAAQAIAEYQKYGVQVKIITGDNEIIAKHIGMQLGLSCESILRGDEISKFTNKHFGEIIEATTIFARIAPQQKQQIVSALKGNGHVVGYIGDGINDAPALHVADVGISVAEATDIAKETADIILLKHSLKVLLLGILEGRRSFGNIMKYLIMSTSSNFGNVFSMAIAVLFLPFLPMLPVQILLNNLLYDLAQITIPNDKVDSDFLRKPSRWDISIIKRFMIYIGPISSFFDFMTFFILITFFKASETLFHTGWFVESLATQTLVIFIIRTTQNPFFSKPSKMLIYAVLAVVGIGIALPYSPLANLLGFVPLSSAYLIFLSITIIAYLLSAGIMKRILLDKINYYNRPAIA